jgi:sugar phosphate isomerase/epimerase
VVDDLNSISASDVMLVHVNDAPAGVERDAQIDQVRTLPMETGVIDLPAFMRKLDDLGYPGPVVAEPFSARLNEIAATHPLEAAQITAESMRTMWRESGLDWSEG